MKTQRLYKSLDTINLLFNLLFSATLLCLAILSSLGFFWTVRETFTGCLLIYFSITLFSAIKTFVGGLNAFNPLTIVELMPGYFNYFRYRYKIFLTVQLIVLFSLHIFSLYTINDYASALLPLFFFSVYIVDSFYKLVMLKLMGE